MLCYLTCLLYYIWLWEVNKDLSGDGIIGNPHYDYLWLFCNFDNEIIRYGKIFSVRGENYFDNAM